MSRSALVSGRQVVHLTSVHPPLDTRILFRQCRSLVRAGYGVVLVAPSREDTVPVDGVDLVPVPEPSNRRERILRTVPAVYRAARESGARLFHLHDPELLPVGVMLGRSGAVVVYDAHEDIDAQIRAKHWIPELARPLVSRAAGVGVRGLSRAVDHVVAATPSIAARWSPGRRTVVQNFPPRSEAQRRPDPPYRDRRPDLVYVGAIGFRRGARQMMRIARRVGEERGGRLLLAGEFSSPAVAAEMRASPGWERVDHLGYVPRSRLPDLLDRARIGLVLLHPTPAYRVGYPTKLFEYMAAGLPVVASDFPLWRRIIEPVGCGVLVDPLDVEEAIDAVEGMLADPERAERMGARGRDAILDRFHWEGQAERLVDLYRSLLIDSG